MGQPVKFVYFAWVRERIGFAEEWLELPQTARTGADVIAFLRSRGEGYRAALDDAQAIRIAADRQHLAPDEPIGEAREIALFPPMTGG
ncbi:MULTISPECIES: molybdopterin converting factor subunit 1 [unclassified Roseitalea]|uniref:molybdopterin converting factor subunit 1 n=1 Tax=unclassified Roseitalea TaxID=2639107 RepID=UPI00273EB18A|nr:MULTISPECIES: molybdopterin converting factor subunit 1 [unclassified Roseitalea]